jgi:hypothetical protein
MATAPGCYAQASNSPDRVLALINKDQTEWQFVISNTLLEAFTLSTPNGPSEFCFLHAERVGGLRIDRNAIDLSYAISGDVLQVSMTIPQDNFLMVQLYTQDKLTEQLTQAKDDYASDGRLSVIPFNKWLYLHTAINCYKVYLAYIRGPYAKILLGSNIDLEAMLRNPGSSLGVGFILPDDYPLVLKYAYNAQDNGALNLEFSCAGVVLDNYNGQINLSGVNASSRAGFSGKVQI